RVSMGGASAGGTSAGTASGAAGGISAGVVSTGVGATTGASSGAGAGVPRTAVSTGDVTRVQPESTTAMASRNTGMTFGARTVRPGTFCDMRELMILLLLRRIQTWGPGARGRLS